jgi:hypothetical protein
MQLPENLLELNETHMALLPLKFSITGCCQLLHQTEYNKQRNSEHKIPDRTRGIQSRMQE